MADRAEPTDATGVNLATAAPAQPPTDAAPPAAAPVTPAQDRSPVPYDRFHEVNEERNRYKTERDQLVKSRDAEVQRLAEEQARGYLVYMAERDPRLHAVLYGEQGAKPGNGKTEPAEAEDDNPMAREVREVRAVLGDVTNRLHLQERNAFYDEATMAADAVMRKYPLLDVEANSKMAERIVMDEINAQVKAGRSPDIEGIVRDANAMVDEVVKANQRAYDDNKRATMAAVPPAVTAGGGGMPAGSPPSKPPSIESGAAREGLQRYIEEHGGLRL